jgi:hypothetical protein
MRVRRSDVRLHWRRIDSDSVSFSEQGATDPAQEAEPLTIYELALFFRERLPRPGNALAAVALWFLSRASRASLNLA